MIPTWGQQRGGATLSLDFINNDNVLDSRITFSRGSAATMYDSTGALVYAPMNLLLQSAAFNTTWSTARGTVTADALVAPDGTTSGDTFAGNGAAGQQGVYQTVTVSASTACTMSVYAKAGTASWINIQGFDGTTTPRAWFDITNGTVGIVESGMSNGQIVSVGNGWFRCSVLRTTGAAATSLRPLFGLATANGVEATGSFLTMNLWGAQLNLYPMAGGVTSSLSTYYPTTTAAYYGPRFDYNPSTLAARGLLIEEQRTNGVRNSSAVGGSVGVSPTNWTASGAIGNGITVTIAAVGTENGIPYVDLNFAGVSTTTGTAIGFSFDTTTGIAASSGQVWAYGLFVKLVSGSLGDGTTKLRLSWRNSSGTNIGSQDSAALSLTNAALSSQRQSSTGTAIASTGFVQPQLTFVAVTGSTYNFTLRVGYPQVELGAFATSVIPTTTAAATRSPDIATMTGTNFSSWYNQSQGTFITQFVLEGVRSVAGQRIITADDGTNTNQILQSGSSTNTFQTTVTTGGATQVSQTVPTITLTGNTVYKTALAYATDNTNSAVNTVLATNDTSCTMPTALTTFRFSTSGNSPTTVNANLWYASLNYYPTRLPDSTLQALTT